MSLHRDLLEQASHLALREPKRPKQASLRRAVSSAYYALFHLLVREAALDAAPHSPTGLRELVQRALGHVEMKNVCKGFVSGNVAYTRALALGKPFQTGDIPPSTQRLLSFPLESDLVVVMSAFVELQEARHEADYNTTTTWNRINSVTKIQVVHSAFAAWERVKASQNASVFKAALFFQKSWGR